MEARRAEGSAAEAEADVETTADGVRRQSEAYCGGGRKGKLGDDRKAVMVELVPAAGVIFTGAGEGESAGRG